MTPQRRVIAGLLVDPRRHLTAEAVHLAAQTELPEMSLATVYNTLNELVTMGELHELSAGPGPKRYGLNTGRKHHHLICQDCNLVIDVDSDFATELTPRNLHGFLLTEVQIVFYGRCPKCDARNHRPDEPTSVPETLVTPTRRGSALTDVTASKRGDAPS